MTRRRGIALGATVVALLLVLVVYPWWASHRTDALFEAGGCDDRRVPTAAFYEAIALGERVSKFPGFDKDDRIYAEASRCVGSFAQACLQAEGEPPASRARICGPWRDYVSFLGSLGVDHRGMCKGCQPEDFAGTAR